MSHGSLWVLGSFPSCADGLSRARHCRFACRARWKGGGGNEGLHMWLGVCRKEIICTTYMRIFSPARVDGSSGCTGNTQHRDRGFGCEEMQQQKRGGNM